MQQQPQQPAATPYQRAQQYAAGEVDRETLVRELVAWDYTRPPATPDPLDDLRFDQPGSVDDLSRALDDGLIDQGLFLEVVQAIRDDA